MHERFTCLVSSTLTVKIRKSHYVFGPLFFYSFKLEVKKGFFKG